MLEHSGAFNRLRRLVELTPLAVGRLCLRRPRLCAVLLCSAVFYPLLGFVPVYEVSEAREGVVVNEILRSGNFVLPLRNGELIPSKPILFHWLGVVAAWATHSYGEFELRLPSAAAATLFLVFFVGFMRALTGAAVAVLSFSILLFSYGFIQLSQDGRVDMLMLLFADGALLFWLYRYWQQRERGGSASDISSLNCLFAALLLGLSVLAKGPLGPVLAGISIAAVVAYQEGRGALRHLLRWEWLVVALVPLPWFVLAALEGSSDFVTRQVFFENFRRFFGGDGIVHRPPWFYLLHVWSQTLPWLFIVAAAAAVLFVRQMPLIGGLTRGQRFALSSGLIWFLAGLVFLSLSSGKRRSYLLPLLPGFAMAAGIFLFDWWRRVAVCEDTGRLYDNFARVAAFCAAACLTVLALAAAAAAGLAKLSDTSLSAIASRFGFEAVATLGAFRSAFEAWPDWSLLLLALIAAASGLYWLAGGLLKSPTSILFGFYGFIAVSFLLFVNLATAAKGVTHTYKHFALSVQEQIPPGERLTVIMKRRDESLDGFFFYFRRHVRTQHPGLPLNRSGLYLARRGWYELQPAEWRKMTSVMTEGGRLIDRPEERFILFRFREA